MLIPASCRRLGLLPYIFCCLFLGLGLFSMLSPSPARACKAGLFFLIYHENIPLGEFP